MIRAHSGRGASGWALLMAVAAAGCVPGSDFEAAEVTLAVTGGSNPTTAIDATTGESFVAWVETVGTESNVQLVRIDPGGTLAEPVRVNDRAGDAAPHFQAPAQVAVGSDGEVYALWTNNTIIPGRTFPASDLRFARSTDGGRSFTSAISVNDDAGGIPSSHTFHNILIGPDGTLFVSWLDSRVRDQMGADAHVHAEEGRVEEVGDHAGHGGSPADDAPGPELRVAVSVDHGTTFTSGVIVDRDTCPCCRTAMAMGPSGELYVAWRKVFEGSVRDVVVARSDDAGRSWSEPRKVHDDQWVFEGCPHAGPALAIADDGTLHVAWYTGKEGASGLFYAKSEDGGRSFGAVHPLAEGRIVAPSISSLQVDGNGDAIIAWEDRTRGQPLVRVGRIGPDGFDERGSETWTGAHPSLSMSGDQGVVAWHRGDTVRVRIKSGS